MRRANGYRVATVAAGVMFQLRERCRSASSSHERRLAFVTGSWLTPSAGVSGSGARRDDDWRAERNWRDVPKRTSARRWTPSTSQLNLTGAAPASYRSGVTHATRDIGEI